MRVRRLSGPKYLQKREKRSEPRIKHAMEVSDLPQPYGLLAGWPDAPSPTKIVFPACESVVPMCRRKRKGWCTGLHGNKRPVRYSSAS